MIDLTNVTKEALKQGYKSLLDAKEAVLIVEMDKKEAEFKLKEEAAEAKGFLKKDGVTLDLAKIKIALLKNAIEINEGLPNKLQENLDIQEEYIADLKNNIIKKPFVDSYVAKLNLAKEVKNDEKDVKEEMKTVLDSDIVETLNILANKEIEIQKQKMMEDDGKEVKTKKDDSELLENIRLIKKELGL
jgi:hypothetical protein